MPPPLDSTPQAPKTRNCGPRSRGPRCDSCIRDHQSCRFTEQDDICDRCIKADRECIIVAREPGAQAALLAQGRRVSAASATPDPKRTLKCETCRRHHQRCFPEVRVWPQKCLRCQTNGYACNPPEERSGRRRRRRARIVSNITPNFQALSALDSISEQKPATARLHSQQQKGQHLLDTLAPLYQDQEFSDDDSDDSISSIPNVKSDVLNGLGGRSRGGDKDAMSNAANAAIAAATRNFEASLPPSTWEGKSSNHYGNGGTMDLNNDADGDANDLIRQMEEEFQDVLRSAQQQKDKELRALREQYEGELTEQRIRYEKRLDDLIGIIKGLSGGGGGGLGS